MGSMEVTPRCSDGWSVLFSNTFFMMNIMCSMNWVFSSLTITWNNWMNYSLQFEHVIWQTVLLKHSLPSLDIFFTDGYNDSLSTLDGIQYLKRTKFPSSTSVPSYLSTQKKHTDIQTIPTHYYLALLIKEFIHNDLNLVKQNWIQQRWHFMPNQLFHMLLNLCSKLFIVADQEFEEVPNKSLKKEYH